MHGATTPERHDGPSPVPEMRTLTSRLGPTRISPRDLALGLRTGMVRLVDITGDATDPESVMSAWVDQGGGKYEYDPMKIYTMSVNSHDHSTESRLRMSREMLAACKIIAGIVPEFGGAQGFMRDAILHSLQWWAKRLESFIDEQDMARIQMLTIRSVADALDEYLDERARYLDDTETRIKRAVELGDWEATETLCDVHEALAEHVPEPYRTKMLGVVGDARVWAGRERHKEKLRVMKERAEKVKMEREELRRIALEEAEHAAGERDEHWD